MLNICVEIGLRIKSAGLFSKPISSASLELFSVKKTTKIDAVVSFFLSFLQVSYPCLAFESPS